MYVWILLIFNLTPIGPTTLSVVDNLATENSCAVLKAKLEQKNFFAECVQVEKAIPMISAFPLGRTAP